MGCLVGAPAFGIKVLGVPEMAPSMLLFRGRMFRSFRVSASSSLPPSSTESIRVRFAPSPTGNLHVGVRALHSSTTCSPGPGVGGDYGPYRQSERNDLYKQYAEKLLQSGHAYRCFCSNEELEKMKEIAKLKQLPPVYSGKWANATDMEVQEELEKGTPYTYRFRVPTTGSLTIDDLIRGEVSWSFDTLGDFVIMRSNGQPVYNFCVTVDDAAMAISHVIRFAHVSLILAPDRSKLSKRHGATSVGQFKEMGFLPQAMVNYLALLGWGDGTENEFFTLDQLVDKFKIERVNKSGAVFDSAKLRWMNGQHLRSLPLEELTKLIGERWKSTGMVVASEGSFIEEAVQLLKDGIDLITDADNALSSLLSYPLYSTLSSLEGKPVLEDKLSEVAANLLTAYDSGDFSSALEEGSAGWQKWVKSFGKSLKRKFAIQGKSLFMPLRVLLTGKLHGPDMGAGLLLVYKAGRCSVVAPGSGFVTLDERFKMLREIEWESFSKDNPAMESAEAVPVSN
ncbi:UNVERIFIED_CONTAM: Glutamate--tRNA ligase, chloroplastic/mitochondrial [Sesamum angustifolium]|uniref:Glutamate--tRNA ligase, chloroplastic/mitochondrial n=1 Tax=Sesamum angustifolium TaxID=2727405 RepID=A0AAW2QDA0_9LAMI